MAHSIKSDTKLMELLGVDVLHHAICWTPKGALATQLRKGETAYKLVLDAVPIEDKELHEELMATIYPPAPIPKEVLETIGRTMTEGADIPTGSYEVKTQLLGRPKSK